MTYFHCNYVDRLEGGVAPLFNLIMSIMQTICSKMFTIRTNGPPCILLLLLEKLMKFLDCKKIPSSLEM